MHYKDITFKHKEKDMHPYNAYTVPLFPTTVAI